MQFGILPFLLIFSLAGIIVLIWSIVIVIKAVKQKKTIPKIALIAIVIVLAFFSYVSWLIYSLMVGLSR
jgi:uncharacterized protein with PQ loop repeat